MISPIDVTRPEPSDTFVMKYMMHAIEDDREKTKEVEKRDEEQEEDIKKTPNEAERIDGALVPFAEVKREESPGESDHEYKSEEDYGTDEDDGWGGSGQTSTQDSDFFPDVPAPGMKKPRSARVCKASSRALVKVDETSATRTKSKGGKKQHVQDQKIEMRYISPSDIFLQ